MVNPSKFSHGYYHLADSLLLNFSSIYGVRGSENAPELVLYYLSAQNVGEIHYAIVTSDAYLINL